MSLQAFRSGKYHLCREFSSDLCTGADSPGQSRDGSTEDTGGWRLAEDQGSKGGQNTGVGGWLGWAQIQHSLCLCTNEYTSKEAQARRGRVRARVTIAELEAQVPAQAWGSGGQRSFAE
jgi:hypothetical protein